MSAVISECGLYRYSLKRSVSDDAGLLVFIMLNPSTADAEIDDPTIRKCKGFSKILGYGEIEVVNLFAYRATNPAVLKTAINPSGTDNTIYIRDAVNRASKVICAWGTNGSLFNKDKYILDVINDHNIFALEITKEGHPKHPLYISYTKSPILFRAAKNG